MALVKPSEPKARITETRELLEVVVPARRNAFLMAFLGLWLIGWAWGVITVPRAFLIEGTESSETMFVAAWLGMWILGGGAALLIFTWSLIGRERICLAPAALVIRRELFSVGRSREYDLSHVKNLRVAPSTFNPFDFRSSFQFWGLGGGPIAFDYGTP